jgi:Arc/MetJ-type ribon-helix-helix transcriptional regulator
MSITLSPELESRIEEAVKEGLFNSPEELVESAVNMVLPPAVPGRFAMLRRKVEESGIKLLNEEELEAEIRSRRGSWA